MPTPFELPAERSFWIPPSNTGEGSKNLRPFDIPLEETTKVVSGLSAHFGRGKNIIVLLMGRRGEGKTVFETSMLQRQLRKWQATGYRGRLYSNYAVSFFRPKVDYYSPYLMDEISMFPPWFRDGYIAFDEIQSAASSRRSMSGSNVNLSTFLTQLRHRGIEAIFTTQFPQVLDYQVLLQVDLFVRIHTIRRAWDGFPLVIEMEIYDFWGQWTGRDHRKPWPPQPQDIDAMRRAVIPPSIRGTFDTHEIIASSYWKPEVRARVLAYEAEAAGHDAEWLESMKPAILAAQDSREDKALRRDGEPLDDIHALITRMVRDAERAGYPIPLQPYLADARKLSGYNVGGPTALVDLFNNAAGPESKVKAWAQVSPVNGSITFLVGARS